MTYKKRSTVNRKAHLIRQVCSTFPKTILRLKNGMALFGKEKISFIGIKRFLFFQKNWTENRFRYKNAFLSKACNFGSNFQVYLITLFGSQQYQKLI
ncbi:hypothetical protein MSSAC_3867 [Methanosarcina siciliae C2J]|uniref:Uncharacterized protein n=1 Tax=Methanosarcina siciliae C2J TaxID=1434118 RepID=A0A0E3PSN2_9EURY|nr:hypothetical protein MSSAC_3867 [Methanosarcina siciliae C2J]